ncbi:MAG: hypothetical protein GY874_18545, partial [Desulfobacteraceae bacterium]|nr:hypothetical protein [Desulfobacteraceae bacterium]
TANHPCARGGKKQEKTHTRVFANSQLETTILSKHFRHPHCGFRAPTQYSYSFTPNKTGASLAIPSLFDPRTHHGGKRIEHGESTLPTPHQRQRWEQRRRLQLRQPWSPPDPIWGEFTFVSWINGGRGL